MKQPVGKIVERESNVVEALGQPGENIGQFAAPRGFVRSDKLIVGATNLFVKFDIRRTAQTAPLSVLAKNAANKEGIIPDVRPEKKSLLGRRSGERDEHVGNVFVGAVVDLVRALQLVRARKSFEKRTDVIAKFTIADAGLLEDVSGEDVKIKLRRNVQMAGVGKNRFD